MPLETLRKISQQDIDHLRYLGHLHTAEELLEEACSLQGSEEMVTSHSIVMITQGIASDPCWLCHADLPKDEPKKIPGIFNPRIVQPLCKRCLVDELRNRDGLQVWFDFRNKLGLEDDLLDVSIALL